MKIFALLSVCVAALVASAESGVAAGATLKADSNQHWYRGNMHTHSLWSDGDDYPEMIAWWYRDHGYDFLVITDHNVLLQGERWVDIEKNKGKRAAFEKLSARFSGDWVETRTHDEREQVKLKTFDEVFERFAEPGKYLLIQGEEITDGYRNFPVHLCVTNTKELLPPLRGDSVFEVMQRNIAAAQSRRERSGVKNLVHLNHPNFHYGVTAEDLMRVVGENFFEVYNGHPSVHNSGDEVHASTERMWDIVNTWRLAKLDLPLMYGLATDDGHDYHRTPQQRGSQPGRGWVMVLADKLDPDSLVTSLEAGRFYSSSGVSLKEIRVADDSLAVDVAAEDGVSYRIDFIGTRKGFDDASAPAVDDEEKAASITRRYSGDVGTTLTTVAGSSATYDFSGDELYVRAVVTSSRKHPNPSEIGEFEKAWVQPVIPSP